MRKPLIEADEFITVEVLKPTGATYAAGEEEPAQEARQALANTLHAFIKAAEQWH
jgi:hypothetical protein